MFYYDQFLELLNNYKNAKSEDEKDYAVLSLLSFFETQLPNANSETLLSTKPEEFEHIIKTLNEVFVQYNSNLKENQYYEKFQLGLSEIALKIINTAEDQEPRKYKKLVNLYRVFHTYHKNELWKSIEESYLHEQFRVIDHLNDIAKLQADIILNPTHEKIQDYYNLKASLGPASEHQYISDEVAERKELKNLYQIIDHSSKRPNEDLIERLAFVCKQHKTVLNRLSTAFSPKTKDENNMQSELERIFLDYFENTIYLAQDSVNEDNALSMANNLLNVSPDLAFEFIIGNYGPRFIEHSLDNRLSSNIKSYIDYHFTKKLTQEFENLNRMIYEEKPSLFSVAITRQLSLVQRGIVFLNAIHPRGLALSLREDQYKRLVTLTNEFNQTELALHSKRKLRLEPSYIDRAIELRFSDYEGAFLRDLYYEKNNEDNMALHYQRIQKFAKQYQELAEIERKEIKSKESFSAHELYQICGSRLLSPSSSDGFIEDNVDWFMRQISKLYSKKDTSLEQLNDLQLYVLLNYAAHLDCRLEANPVDDSEFGKRVNEIPKLQHLIMKNDVVSFFIGNLSDEQFESLFKLKPEQMCKFFDHKSNVKLDIKKRNIREKMVQVFNDYKNTMPNLDEISSFYPSISTSHQTILNILEKIENIQTNLQSKDYLNTAIKNNVDFQQLQIELITLNKSLLTLKVLSVAYDNKLIQNSSIEEWVPNSFSDFSHTYLPIPLSVEKANALIKAVERSEKAINNQIIEIILHRIDIKAYRNENDFIHELKDVSDKLNDQTILGLLTTYYWNTPAYKAAEDHLRFALGYNKFPQLISNEYISGINKSHESEIKAFFENFSGTRAHPEDQSRQMNSANAILQNMTAVLQINDRRMRAHMATEINDQMSREFDKKTKDKEFANLTYWMPNKEGKPLSIDFTNPHQASDHLLQLSLLNIDFKSLDDETSKTLKAFFDKIQATYTGSVHRYNDKQHFPYYLNSLTFPKENFEGEFKSHSIENIATQLKHFMADQTKSIGLSYFELFQTIQTACANDQLDQLKDMIRDDRQIIIQKIHDLRTAEKLYSMAQKQRNNKHWKEGEFFAYFGHHIQNKSFLEKFINHEAKLYPQKEDYLVIYEEMQNEGALELKNFSLQLRVFLYFQTKFGTLPNRLNEYFNHEFGDFGGDGTAIGSNKALANVKTQMQTLLQEMTEQSLPTESVKSLQMIQNFMNSQRTSNHIGASRTQAFHSRAQASSQAFNQSRIGSRAELRGTGTGGRTYRSSRPTQIESVGNGRPHQNFARSGQNLTMRSQPNLSIGNGMITAVIADQAVRGLAPELAKNGKSMQAIHEFAYAGGALATEGVILKNYLRRTSNLYVRNILKSSTEYAKRATPTIKALKPIAKRWAPVGIMIGAYELFDNSH